MYTTTTAVELEEYPHGTVTQRDVPSTSLPVHADPILEESRLADATVPDGGYGWVVLAGCAVLTWWFVGTTYAWGILQSALVADGLGTAATLAFVGSVPTGLISALALINARLVRVLGIRRTGLLGVALLGMGELTSGWAVQRLPALFVTAGLVMGLGVSLCFTTVSVTPAQYFSRRRGLANGIVFAGGGLGGAVTTYMLQALVTAHGPAFAYRILGVLTLATGLPAAWAVKERVPLRARGFIDWALFRDPKFFLIFFAGAIATFPLLVPAFFLPQYAVSIGLSSATAAGLLAGYNLASAFGRIVCGFLCDRLGPVNTLLAGLVLNALSMLALWPASTTLPSLAAFVVINGAANGSYFASMPTVVGNVFGSQRVAVAMGMVVTGWVGGYLMGAPIAGYILQAYGGADSGLKAFRPAMFYAGSLSLVAALSIVGVRLRLDRSPFKRL